MQVTLCCGARQPKLDLGYLMNVTKHKLKICHYTENKLHVLNTVSLLLRQNHRFISTLIRNGNIRKVGWIFKHSF